MFELTDQFLRKFNNIYEQTVSRYLNVEQIKELRPRLVEKIHFFSLEGMLNYDEQAFRSAMELRYALYGESPDTDPWVICKKITRKFDPHWVKNGVYYHQMINKEKEFQTVASSFLKKNELYSFEKLARRVESVAALQESDKTIGKPSLKMYHAVQVCHCIFLEVINGQTKKDNRLAVERSPLTIIRLIEILHSLMYEKRVELETVKTLYLMETTGQVDSYEQLPKWWNHFCSLYSETDVNPIVIEEDLFSKWDLFNMICMVIKEVGIEKNDIRALCFSKENVDEWRQFSLLFKRVTGKELTMDEVREMCFIEFAASVELAGEHKKLPKWNLYFLKVFPKFASDREIISTAGGIKRRAIELVPVNTSFDADLFCSAIAYRNMLNSDEHQDVRKAAERLFTKESPRIFVKVIKDIALPFLSKKENQNLNLSFLMQTVNYLHFLFLEKMRKEHPDATLVDLKRKNREYLKLYDEINYYHIHNVFNERNIKGKTSWENILSNLPFSYENVHEWIENVVEKNLCERTKWLFSPEVVAKAIADSKPVESRQSRIYGTESIRGALRLMQEVSITTQMQQAMLIREKRKQVISDLRNHTEQLYKEVCKKRQNGALYTLKINVGDRKHIRAAGGYEYEIGDDQRVMINLAIDSLSLQETEVYSSAEGSIDGDKKKCSFELIAPGLIMEENSFGEIEITLIEEAEVEEKESKGFKVMIRIPKIREPEGDVRLAPPYLLIQGTGDPEMIKKDLLNILRTFLEVDISESSQIKFQMNKTVFSDLYKLHKSTSEYIQKGVLLARVPKHREFFAKNCLQLIHSLYSNENHFILTAFTGAFESCVLSRLDFVKELIEDKRVGKGKSEKPFILLSDTNLSSYRELLRKSTRKVLPYLGLLTKDWVPIEEGEHEDFNQIDRALVADKNFFCKCKNSHKGKKSDEPQTTIIKDIQNSTQSDDGLNTVLFEISETIQPRKHSAPVLPDFLSESLCTESGGASSDSFSCFEFEDIETDRIPITDLFYSFDFDLEKMEQAIVDLNAKTWNIYQVLIEKIHQKDSQPLYDFKKYLVQTSEFYVSLFKYFKRILSTSQSTETCAYTLHNLLEFAHLAYKQNNHLVFFATWKVLSEHKEEFQREKKSKALFAKLKKAAKKFNKGSNYKNITALPYPYFSSKFPVKAGDSLEINDKYLNKFIHQVEDYTKAHRSVLSKRKYATLILDEVYSLHKEAIKRQSILTPLYFAQRKDDKSLSVQTLRRNRVKMMMPRSARMLNEKRLPSTLIESEEHEEIKKIEE